MREPAEKMAGSCAEAAKIGLTARESCANRLNYFHFRRCANHARDYGNSVFCLLSLPTSAAFIEQGYVTQSWSTSIY